MNLSDVLTVIWCLIWVLLLAWCLFDLREVQPEDWKGRGFDSLKGQRCMCWVGLVGHFLIAVATALHAMKVWIF